MKKCIIPTFLGRAIPGLAAFLIAAIRFAPQAEGAIIWDGPTISFTQPGTDPTQATNQDRLTPNVWLTRDIIQGLFNAISEGAYTHNSSPADTEWAFGELADYDSLSYTDWEDLYGGSAGGEVPTSLIGQDTVVHLISEDIYLSIVLTSWGVHGGTFAYIRSTPNFAPTQPTLTNPTILGDGTFQFAFTDTPGFNFTVLATTNLSLPTTNWTVLGQATYAPAGPGSYQFVDPGAGTSPPLRFYLLRWP